MKKRTVLARLAVLGVALGGLVLAGCSFTTAELSEATMCLAVDSSSQPVNPTDTFGRNTPEIFCSVKLSNAPEDTEILSEWVYVKGEVAGVTDYVIDSLSLTTDGTRYMQFSLGIPDGGWPVGEYKLVLYVDGKEEVSVPFEVAITAELSEGTMALGVDALSRPINSTTTFPASTPEIFCSVLISNAPAATEVVSEWYLLNSELLGASDVLIDSASILVAEGTQYLSFSLTIPDAGWPAGEYALVLYVNGQQQLLLPFTVSAAPITATMAMNIDANNQPVNPTTTFPAGVEKVWTVMFMNDVAPGAKLLVEWYEVGGEVDAYINKYETAVEVRELPYAVYLTRGTGGWPQGQYAAVVSLNGERQVVLPFTVG